MDVSGPNTSAPLRQRLISGVVEPASAVIGGTTVRFSQIFEGCAMPNIGITIEPDVNPTSPDRGNFDDEIIYGSNNPGSDYTVWASGLDNYWQMTSQTVNVQSSGTVASQAIATEPGGTLEGTVTYAIGGAGVEDVIVGAYHELGGFYYGMTDNEGAYRFELPAGNVMMSLQAPEAMSGALNFLNYGTEVVVGGFTQRYFVQGPWSGEIRAADGPIDESTIMGTTGAVADNDGQYSVKFIEGLNWVCVNPNTSPNSTYEFKCFYDIEVTPEDLE